MTRTDAILQALSDELRRLRLYLDTADTLTSVQFTVKLIRGTTEVRGVIFSPEERSF